MRAHHRTDDSSQKIETLGKLTRSAAHRAEKPAIQLSIFEVEPPELEQQAASAEPIASPIIHTIDTSFAERLALRKRLEAAYVTEAEASEPTPIRNDAQAVASNLEPSRASWQSIQLDPKSEPLVSEVQFVEPATIAAASMSRRLLAAVVDLTILVAMFALLALLAALIAPGSLFPDGGLKVGALAVVVLYCLYYGLFTLILRETPGARIAELRLTSTENEKINDLQLWIRFITLPLSVLSLGVGVMWTLFDANHLSWHDKLSRTYLKYPY